jgi:tetratricopeptide (TPR) repeat protein
MTAPWRAARIGAAALALCAAAVACANSAAPPTDRGLALARSVTGAERRWGSSSPKLLPLLAKLAQIRFEEADFAAATALRRRAFTIAIAGFGADSATAAMAMAALAHLYVEQRRYLDAEPLLIVAANTLNQGPAAAAPLAAALADRARVALARGENQCAEGLARRAAAIDQTAVGAVHSDRLRILGAVLVVEQKFGAAETALRRAVELDRAGGDQPATARSLAALADAYLRQQHFALALPAIEEATAIDQDRLSPLHALIAEDFDDLGLVYLGLERVADGARALRTSAAILERGTGRDTPVLGYVQLDLARAEHLLGHDGKAKALFAAARRILNAAEDEERDRQRRA